MRAVHPPRMVAHLWANQTQEHARNQNRSFWFNYAIIYSYGDHFPIARHVQNKQGKRAVLFTTRGYSVTTARHKSLARNACRHLTVFYVDDVRSKEHGKQFREFKRRFDVLATEYTKARARKPDILEEMESLVDSANEFAEFFGLKSRLEMPEDLEAMEAECKAQAQREIRRNQRRRAMIEKQRAEQLRKVAEQLEDWMNGASNAAVHSFGCLPVRMRINGDKVETSLGAEFPLDHAIKAFRIMRAIRERGDSWQRNGQEIRLGHFHVDSINGQGVVKAGCHTVEWAEIERVAALAGVL